MGYEYLEHISDVGVHAEGRDLSSAIEYGTAAMLAVMFDPRTISEECGIDIRASAPEPDTLFVEVLSLQGLKEMALKRLETVEISDTPEWLKYRGRAMGEKFDSERHVVRTEVKGATYSRLSYSNPEEGQYVLECVLDV